MHAARPAVILLTLVLSACVTTYPKTEPEQAQYHVDKAVAAADSGDCATTFNQVSMAIFIPTANGRIKAAFAKNPKALNCYLDEVSKSIEAIVFADQANHVFATISDAKATGILDAERIAVLQSKLSSTMEKGVLSGSIQLVLGDPIENFPSLASSEIQARLVENTIKRLQQGWGNRPVAALAEYVFKAGPASAEGRRIEALLPSFNIKRDELAAIEKAYPAYSSARLEAVNLSVFLHLKNGDRLLQDDFKKMLQQRAHGIAWVPAPGPKTVTLTIEKVRQEERLIPSRTETVAYPQHQVDMAKAVLLMPNNSTYMYEIVTSGAEIDYGYVVKTEVAGKTEFDEVVRGKLGGESRRCQNMRIQNVFGGTSAAGFTANDDMKARCSSSSGSDSIDQLRLSVMWTVIDAVLKAPSIKAVGDLN